MNALQARIDRVRIDGRDLIGDIDLAIPQGRWTAIVGPNGAGKSTLLRAIAGLQRCEGAVHLAGRPLADWPARERARQLAWMGQQETGADDLTALDVVLLGRLPHRPWLAPPTAADHEATRVAMQATQSWGWRERRLASLSGGERQRVLLARVLAVQAPLTLMDEPLAHLDPPHQADWMALVRALVHRAMHLAAETKAAEFCALATYLGEMIGHVHQLLHGSGEQSAAAHRRTSTRRLRLARSSGTWRSA